MRISEIFYSIQGEGELTGIPSVFVRTSGCNLRCRWCDTKYASWDPEGEERSLAEIVEVVESHPCSHVVITGGEPMIAREMPELGAELKRLGKHVTIETAATVLPDGIACDLASLSPKLSNATPHQGEIQESWIEKHEARRLQPDVMDAWLASYPFQLKFVVATAGDLDEIEALLARLKTPVPSHKVLLMPEGLTSAAIRGRDETLIDLCKKKGYRYCNRLHLDLFGNTRGT